MPAAEDRCASILCLSLRMAHGKGSRGIQERLLVFRERVAGGYLATR